MLNKKNLTAAQARRKNPKHHEPINPSRMAYVRNVISVWYREDHNGTPCLLRDDEGRMFYIVKRSLGLPDDRAEQEARWRMEMTPQQREDLERDAMQFVPTPINIGMALKLTNAKRDQLANRLNAKGKRSLRAILEIIPCDVPDWDAELRQRDAKRRKDKRREARTELLAQQTELMAHCRDPREATLIKVMTLISRQPWPDLSVQNITRTIADTSARENFPPFTAPLRVAVHRILNRLARRGVVKT